MTFQPTKPAAADYLATSQLDIQTNANLSNTYFALNHVTFDAATDQGKHTKIQFNDNNAVGAPAGTQSEIYTLGTPPEALFKNSAKVAHMSGILAWCVFDGATGNFLAATTQHGVSGVVRNSATTYTITFAPVLANANYGVLITGMSGTTPFAASVQGLPGAADPTDSTLHIVTGGNDLPRITVMAIGN